MCRLGRSEVRRLRELVKVGDELFARCSEFCPSRNLPRFSEDFQKLKERRDAIRAKMEVSA